MKRTVKDVMTTEVMTVHTWTPYKDVLRLIETAKVSAVPVLDDADRLAGIISEADLLLKQEERHGERHRIERTLHRVNHEKATGGLAWHLMSAPVITVTPATPISDAARAIHKHGVKRLVVVDDTGAIAGIVSRRDLLKVFLRPDDEIGREVHHVIEQKFCLTKQEADLLVSVAKGVVHVRGRVDRRSMVDILVQVISDIEGVVGVENRMSYDTDDTHLRPDLPTTWGILASGRLPR